MRPAFFILIFLIEAPFIWSQEIGVTASQLYSDNYELQNPFGYGIFIALPSNSSFQIQFEYSNHQNTRKYFGPLFRGFYVEPLILENVESKSKITSYEFSLLKSLFLSPRSSFYIGAGISRNHLQDIRKGLRTNRSLKLADESRWGYQIILRGERILFKNLPLHGFGTVKIKNLPSFSTGTDVEFPFGESLGFIQIQIGIVFKI